MLPAHVQELLTAAVDGELSPAERRLVDKVLRESEEARKLHGQLIADAERLRKLPPAVPAEDLAANVLGVINERGMKPTPLPMPRRPRPAWNASTLLTWVSLSSAAGVLIAISIGSYLYFAASQQGRTDAGQNVAKNAPAAPADEPAKKIDQPSKPVVDEGLAIEIGPRPREVPDAVVAVPKVREPELLPDPRIHQPDNLITSPAYPDMPPVLIDVKVRLPLLLPLHDLDQEYPRKKLAEELKRDEVVHIDLFCKESGRGAEVIQAALRARGHQVLVDAAALERLKKKQKTELVFYTESLTTAEIAALLEQLGADDKKAGVKKPGDAQFDKFMLAPFQPADLGLLARLLGVAPAQLKMPKSKPPAALDPRKRLEGSTAAHLVTTLPKPAAPSSANAPKLTLLVSAFPANANPQASKEIKSFLEKRGERRAGTVPLMLILRTIN